MMFPKNPKNPKNKYGADLTAGKSKLEHAVDLIMTLRERAGEIKNLRRQVTLVLQDGPRNQRITWRIDFAFDYCNPEAPGFAEAKGMETDEYKLKLKLFRVKPQGKLEIWKGTHRNPQLTEVISP